MVKALKQLKVAKDDKKKDDIVENKRKWAVRFENGRLVAKTVENRLGYVVELESG